MPGRSWTPLLLTIAMVLAPAVAQELRPPGVPPPGVGSRETAHPSGERNVAVYRESISRELFFGCDADGDDRLDLFEACDALESLGDPRDGTAFRRLDRDRDGFLSFAEFDQHFRNITQRGGTLRVRLCRKLAADALELRTASAATPIQRFLQLHDQNGDGGLDPDEIDRFVRQAQLPTTTAVQLKALDLDRSGRVDEAELRPYFDTLSSSLPRGLLPPRSAGGKGLSPALADLDRDGDGTLDQDELAAALRGLDPALAGWAPALLASLDSNRNGRLEPAELGVKPNPPRQ